ncbi:hypothetical protein HDU76_008665, partial [Blyttiomyces sp. JEL0837]
MEEKIKKRKPKIKIDLTELSPYDKNYKDPDIEQEWSQAKQQELAELYEKLRRPGLLRKQAELEEQQRQEQEKCHQNFLRFLYIPQMQAIQQWYQNIWSKQNNEEHLPMHVP